MENLVCPICGEVTSSYMGNYRKDRLCKSHAFDLKNGKLELCVKCETFHFVGKPCKCGQKRFSTLPTEGFDKCVACGAETTGYAFCRSCFRNYTEEEMLKRLNRESTAEVPAVVNDIEYDESDETSDLTCIICGEISNGKHFCYSCYKKYKDKSIDIRIINCRETQILDEYGNLTIECDDGRRVRSRAEALISNFLYNNKIRSVYEKTVFYDDPDTGESKTLHPDFYLPDYDIYIEYNEIKKKSYLKSKEYTQKIYDMLKYKVIIMDDQDLNSIANCLKPKLKIN